MYVENIFLTKKLQMNFCWENLKLLQDIFFNLLALSTCKYGLLDALLQAILSNELFHLISVPPCRGYMFLIVIPLRNSKPITLYP